MINRVFKYSEEEARKNNIHFSMKGIYALISIPVIGFCVLVFYIIWNLVDIEGSGDIGINITGCIIGFIAIILAMCYLGSKVSVVLRAKLSGYAVDNENKVYAVYKLDNSDSYFIGGLAAGSMLDQAIDSSIDLGNLGGAIGGILGEVRRNKTMKLMQNFEFIAQIVETAKQKTINGALVTEIVKVHGYTEHSKYVKIHGDFRNLNTGRIKYNKTLKVYKTYNNFEELINAIINVK